MGARPGGKELLGKNHEAASVSWTGRSNRPNPPGKFFSPGTGDRPVAPSARRILRKPVEASRKRASPADAFYPEPPCPRATTEASRNCQTLKSPPAERRVYGNEITTAMSSVLCSFSANIHHKLLGPRFGIKKGVGAGFKPAPTGFQILVSRRVEKTHACQSDIR
jgi:hypothetical protein